MITNICIFPPLLLLLHCIFIFIFKKWLGPVGTFYTSVSLLWFCVFLLFRELLCFLTSGTYVYVDYGRWFFCLDLIDSHLIFCIDTLALSCSLLVLILTILALYFGVEYMYREAFINRLLYLLFMFATSVVFLFFCYDFFLIILLWECVGLFSLLLVNFYSMRIYTVKATLKTFIFSRISDLFMFSSFILAVTMFNTTDLSLIFLQLPFLSFHYIFIGYLAIHSLTLFSLCLALSGVIKAAQFFSHVWLPDAMEAPTPASALIHSSTLVVAGIFLILRFSLLFEFVVFTNYYLAALGAITLAFGSVAAVFQSDIKKLVAYSTISQIGYLVCGCGFCCYEEVLIYLIVHALNKAFLFILVGYVVHFFNHNTDLRQMGGVYLYSYDLTILLFGVSLNLAGLPYSAGFLAKEFLLFQILRDDFLSLLVRGCWLISFFFTPIYVLMISFIAIFGIKKSTLLAYLGFWSFNFLSLLKVIHNFSGVLGTYRNFNSYLLFRFQWTVFTCRPTIYVLFFFWNFFFYFGEFLFMLMLNFCTLSDVIPSSFFNSLNSTSLTQLNINSDDLDDNIFFFILFFTLLALVFIFNFMYESKYKHLDNLFIVDLFVILFTLYTFLPNFFIFSFALLLGFLVHTLS